MFCFASKVIVPSNKKKGEGGGGGGCDFSLYRRVFMVTKICSSDLWRRKFSIHVCTDDHMYVRTRAHMCRHSYMRARARTHTHTHTHTYTHTRTHTHTHTHTQSAKTQTALMHKRAFSPIPSSLPPPPSSFSQI